MKNDLRQDILKYNERVYRYALKVLQNSSDAMDCTQEVLLKLWQNKLKFESHPNPAGYVFLIAKNACLDKLKENNKFPGRELNEWDAQTEMDPETRESAQILMDLIEKLEEPQKSIVKMRDLEDREYEYISEKTGLTVNNIRVILSRSRKQLRDELNKINAYGEVAK